MELELLMRFVEAGRLQAFFLLSLRVAAVFVMTPVFYAAAVPPTVRALLLIGLSMAVAVGLQPEALPQSLPMDELLSAAFSELALGATLGLGILLAFGAFAVAGNLLDVQVGFGMGQVIDPVTRRSVPVLTSAFQQFALLFFFVLDGHHALLRGIAFGLERFPVGSSWLGGAFAVPVLKQAGGLFALGFALVAPVVFCILLVELALGVVARSLPQMNMFAMGIPIKVAVCLAALSLWFVGIGSTMNRVYLEIVKSWEAMLSVQTAPAPLASRWQQVPGRR